MCQARETLQQDIPEVHLSVLRHQLNSGTVYFEQTVKTVVNVINLEETNRDMVRTCETSE